MRSAGGPEVLELVERPEPQPGPGEVVARVDAVAVNRLDIWVREDVGHAYAARLPVIPGYDVGGEVAAVGAAVTGVAVGERVYVHYDYSCGRCAFCLEGDEAACAAYEVMGVQRDGGYAELVLAPARNIFQLPDGVPHALRPGRPAPGRDRARHRRRVGRRRRRHRARRDGGCPCDRDRLD